MRNIFSIFLFPTVLLLTGCYTAEPQSQTLDSQSESELYTQHENAIPGRLAIYVDEDLATQLENLTPTRAASSEVWSSQSLTEAGIVSIKRMFPNTGRFEARKRESGLHRWFNVVFDESVASTRVANGFFEHSGVQKVQDKIRHKQIDEKPTIIRDAATRANDEEDPFNDPYLYLQWHYKNDADVEGFVKGMDINVAPLWESGVTGHPDVIVAIVDGGIDYDHPDLAANMFINYAELNGVEGYDDDGNGYDDDIYGYNFVLGTGAISEHDHGTHVAGTVAAVNNNSVGVSGVAGGNGEPNSGIRLLSCQMLHTDTSTGVDSSGEDECAAEAIVYGADMGAVISQNSWGYSSAYLMDYDTEAIDYFTAYAGIDEAGNQTGPMIGGIVLFAAGNDSVTYSNPGQHSTAVSVTAISPDGQMAPYSNYGDWADISAPGGEQVRWEAYVGGVFSTIPVGKYEADYGSYTGTSMACPHVSGVIALYLSKCIEDGTSVGLTRDMVVERLLSTTRTLIESEPDYYSVMGSGLVDASRFVGIETTTTPDAVSDLRVGTTGHDNVTMAWSIPNNAKGYTLYVSEESFSGVDFDNVEDNDDITVIDVNKFANDQGYMESTITNLIPEQSYNVTIRSWDYGGNVSDVCQAVSVTTVANCAPYIYKDELLMGEADQVDVYTDTPVKLTYSFVDPEGDDFSYSFTKGSDAESEPIYNSTTNIFTLYIVGSKVAQGDYTATITVTDEYEGATELKINYTVMENIAPEVVTPISDISLSNVGATHQINLDEIFYDEQSPISYSVTSSDDSIIAAELSESSSLLLEALNYGTSTITIVATDTLGLSTTVEFAVMCSSSTATYSIVLYPNPVSTTLNINTDAPSIDKVILYDSRGVEQQRVEGVAGVRTIDVSSLATGVYSVDVVISGKSNIKTITKI